MKRLIIVLLLTNGCMISKKNETLTSLNTSILHGGDVRYWDLLREDGLMPLYGWSFNLNRTHEVFFYKNSSRFEINYHDIYFDKPLKWLISGDTLLTHNKIYKFKILSLNNNILQIIDFSGYLGFSDTLIFVPSKNQISKVISGK